MWNSTGPDRTFFPHADGGVTEFYKLSFSSPSPHFWIKRKIFFGNTHQSSLLTDDSDCYGWNANWEQTHITENINSRPPRLFFFFSPSYKRIKLHQITTARGGQLKGTKIKRPTSNGRTKGEFRLNVKLILGAVHDYRRCQNGNILWCELNMLWHWWKIWRRRKNRRAKIKVHSVTNKQASANISTTRNKRLFYVVAAVCEAGSTSTSPLCNFNKVRELKFPCWCHRNRVVERMRRSSDRQSSSLSHEIHWHTPHFIGSHLNHRGSDHQTNSWCHFIHRSWRVRFVLKPL